MHVHCKRDIWDYRGRQETRTIWWQMKCRWRPVRRLPRTTSNQKPQRRLQDWVRGNQRIIGISVYVGTEGRQESDSVECAIGVNAWSDSAYDAQEKCSRTHARWLCEASKEAVAYVCAEAVLQAVPTFIDQVTKRDLVAWQADEKAIELRKCVAQLAQVNRDMREQATTRD